MWPVYKKSAAMQVKLIQSTRQNDQYKTLLRNGSVFIEFANAVEGKDKEYDWKNKLNFAIGIGDFPIVYTAYRELLRSGKMDLKLFHDPNAGTDKKGGNIKTFQIINGSKAGTFFIGLSQTEPKLKISLPLSVGELYMFIKFIEDNQNSMLGEENYVIQAAK
jgi:hypothetical protein